MEILQEPMMMAVGPFLKYPNLMPLQSKRAECQGLVVLAECRGFQFASCNCWLFVTSKLMTAR